MSVYLEQQMDAGRYAQLVEWITRLRSGKIGQTIEQLAVGDCRCCLGVLRDVLGSEEGDEEVCLYSGYGILLNRSGYAFGWRDDFPGLANLNDDGESFTDIADILESDFEGLLDGKPVELV